MNQRKEFNIDRKTHAAFNSRLYQGGKKICRKLRTANFIALRFIAFSMCGDLTLFQGKKLTSSKSYFKIRKAPRLELVCHVAHINDKVALLFC